MDPQQYAKLVADTLDAHGVIPVLGDLDDTTIAIVQPAIYRAANMGLEAITFHITTHGGYLDVVTAIEATFQAFGIPTIGIIIGYAYSGGAMLLSSCDIRCATPSSSLILHYGALSMENREISAFMHRRYSNDYTVRFWEHRIDQILARCKLSREELVQAMEIERHFTAQEALECGLIDKIIVPNYSVCLPEETSI